MKNLRRNLPSTLAVICFPCCGAGGWDPRHRPDLHGQSALLVRPHGHSEYRSQHSGGGDIPRRSSWGGKHVTEVCRIAHSTVLLVTPIYVWIIRRRSCSPRPTPVVADVVAANAQARDCIQVCAGKPGSPHVFEFFG